MRERDPDLWRHAALDGKEGRALPRLGDLDQALTDLNRAIEIDPSSDLNYRERGQVYAAVGEQQRAIEDYTRAITLSSGDASASGLRADLHMAMDNSQDAIADYSEAIRLAPEHIAYRRQRAEAHRLAGDTSAAEADLAQVDREEPLRRAYEAYLKAAQAMTAQGLKQTYDEADTRAKWSVKMILGGMLIGLSFAVFGLFLFGVSGSEFVGVFSLVVGGLFAFAGLQSAFQTANETRRLSTLYLKTIANNETHMPGFEEFFKRYLQARESTNLQDLPRRTRFLFESGGPAHAALHQHQR